jgi:hypothetical protein
MTYSSSTSPEAVDAILQCPKQKAYYDLRDRASYVYVTGCFPTHLRAEANELLRLISTFSETPTSLGGRTGTIVVCEEAVVRLGLADHPMAAQVRAYLDKGYRIASGRGSNTRRPFGKTFLYRRGGGHEERIVVQRDGSVLDNW